MFPIPYLPVADARPLQRTEAGARGAVVGLRAHPYEDLRTAAAHAAGAAGADPARVAPTWSGRWGLRPGPAAPSGRPAA
ncbi:hypothetical protein [Streptomyces erythrochromogenes]|uniref:hypothetical protein n=1 Tax=Streptomyces erythrochromogenes TaxID=285574 RepID=UPI003680231B